MKILFFDGYGVIEQKFTLFNRSRDHIQQDRIRNIIVSEKPNNIIV